MSILHISCSPRGEMSDSLALSNRVIGHLLASCPNAVVVKRELWTSALEPIDLHYAHMIGPERKAPEGRATARSDALIMELEESTALVIATPMHNYTVPSPLKVWIDHVIRAHRTFEVSPTGKRGLLSDRPVYLAITSGSFRTGERCRQPDFLVPYLVAVLGMIGLNDITTFSMEGLSFGELARQRAQHDAERAVDAHFENVHN